MWHYGHTENYEVESVSVASGTESNCYTEIINYPFQGKAEREEFQLKSNSIG